MQALRLEVERLLRSRDTDSKETLRQEVVSRERILVAELRQSDRFTKRA